MQNYLINLKNLNKRIELVKMQLNNKKIELNKLKVM
jgi:hypothetical protein